MITQSYTIHSPDAMITLGTDIARNGHYKLLLNGDLGAGKTHCTKGFVHYFGIDPTLVTSPTYTYLNIYNNQIVHIDMYRIQDPSILHTKGILDIIHTYDYCIIERPKYTDMYIDRSRTHITITKDDDTTRQVLIH